MKFYCIVVLGGGINIDGSLPKIAKVRVDKAIALYKTGKVPRMIMSGKWSINAKKNFPLSEAEAMEKYAVSQGVNKDDILVEKESQDTLGNAYFTKINFLKPAHWKKFLVVTTDLHVVRTKYLFEKVFGDGYKIKFIGVRSGLSKKQIIAVKRLEKEKLDFYKTYLNVCRNFIDFDKPN